MQFAVRVCLILNIFARSHQALTRLRPLSLGAHAASPHNDYCRCGENRFCWRMAKQSQNMIYDRIYVGAQLRFQQKCSYAQFDQRSYSASISPEVGQEADELEEARFLLE